MSINSVDIFSELIANINGTPTAITNWTYILDLANIDAAGVLIYNNTSPNVQVTIKFSNPGSYNKKQIIIKNNKITIDGENQPLDLSGELLYNGLIHIDDGLSNININNINIKVNSVSTLNGNRRAWVCEGDMNNTGVTFTNCILSSINDININTNFSGGICGGDNGSQNSTNDTVTLVFNNCTVSSINDINFGGSSAGGICGGVNGGNTLTGNTTNVTLTFTNCNLNSGNNINTSGNSTGSICGGSNCVSTSTGSTTTINIVFTNCDVVATGNIINNNNSGGIICGGGNGYNNFGTSNISAQLTFMSCDVSALNITNNNFASGGICGGANGSGNASNVTGLVNLTFNTCIVSTTNDITINGNSDGGICGGYNGYSNNGNNVSATLNFTACNLYSSGGIAINTTNNGGICGGNNQMTVNFINCILYYCTFITFEGGDISSVTFFYLLPGPPLYIIGNNNSNTMNLDRLSGIQSNCLPPPAPAPQPEPIIPKECLCPKPPIPKQGISFGGNLNIPGHEEAQAFRISYQLINSLYVHGGRTEFYNAQQNRSSKPPPRNTFG